VLALVCVRASARARYSRNGDTHVRSGQHSGMHLFSGFYCCDVYLLDLSGSWTWQAVREVLTKQQKLQLILKHTHKCVPVLNDPHAPLSTDLSSSGNLSSFSLGASSARRVSPRRAHAVRRKSREGGRESGAL
jgi:hypothetical protein